MIGLGSRKKSSGFVSVSITDQFLMDLFSIGGLFVPGLWTNIRIYFEIFKTSRGIKKIFTAFLVVFQVFLAILLTEYLSLYKYT